MIRVYICYEMQKMNHTKQIKMTFPQRGGA
jgi:hypothetical protein